jgi:hypothetical protein
MCSIFQLLEGYTIPKELLFNAMHNNEHGYGILLKDNKTKKIKLISKLTTEPEVDEVYKILKDNEDCERWVHLRNQSAGEVNTDNVQPFHVFHSNKRDVFWMHNGTIYTGGLDYSDAIKDRLVVELDTKKDSDSRVFAFSKIQPFINHWKGEKGFGDIHDSLFVEHFRKLWSSGWGRSVFVSSDQPALLLSANSWEEIDDGNGGTFTASNDTYFKKLTRGKLYLKQEAERRAKEAEENKNKPNALDKLTVNKIIGITELTSSSFRQTYFLSEEFQGAFHEIDLFDEDCYALLNLLSFTEIKNIMLQHPESFVVLFMNLTETLSQALEQKQPKESEVHVG